MKNIIEQIKLMIIKWLIKKYLGKIKSWTNQLKIFVNKLNALIDKVNAWIEKYGGGNKLISKMELKEIKK